MRSMNSLRRLIIVCFLVFGLSTGWAAEGLSLRVWEFSEADWEVAKVLLESMSGALVAGGKTLDVPEGAWARFDERKRLVAVRDTIERLQALEKLLGREALDENMQWRLIELGSNMALKSKNHVRHQLTRRKAYEDVDVDLVIFESDLLVKAPTENMSEIAGWVESIQPKKQLVAQEPEERRSALLRHSVLSRRREPSPYLTGRPARRGGFMAGYSHSSSAAVSGMGRYGSAQSSTGISLYADDGMAVIDLRHQNSSYMLDAVNGYLDFGFGSSGRNISFSNGVTSIW